MESKALLCFALLASFLVTSILAGDPSPPPPRGIPAWIANTSDQVPDDPSQFSQLRSSGFEASIQKSGSVFFLVKALLDGSNGAPGPFNTSFWGLGLVGFVENAAGTNLPVRAAFASSVSSKASDYNVTNPETGNTVRVRRIVVSATFTVRSVPQTPQLLLDSPLPGGWPIVGSCNATVAVEAFSEATDVLYGNETVRVTERDFKLSANTTAWPFSSNLNDLTLVLKVRSAARDGRRVAEDVQSVLASPAAQQLLSRARSERFEFGQRLEDRRSAALTLPVFAMIDGVKKSINITAAGPFIALRVPSFNRGLFYDPVMQVSQPFPGSGNDDLDSEDKLVADRGRDKIVNAVLDSDFKRIVAGNNDTAAYVRRIGQEVFFMAKARREDASASASDEERFGGDSFWGLSVAGLVEVSPSGRPVRAALVLNITHTAERKYIADGNVSAVEITVTAKATVVQVPSLLQRMAMADASLSDIRNWTVAGAVDVGFTVTAFTNGTRVPYGSGSIHVAQGDVKFSKMISAWPFSNPSNTLRVILRARHAGRSGSEKDETVQRSLTRSSSLDQRLRGFLFGRDAETGAARSQRAEMSFPAYALVDGAEANITIDVRGSFLVISLPSFTGSAFYDPTLGIRSAPASAAVPSGAQQDLAARILDAATRHVDLLPENFDKLAAANSVAWIAKRDSIFFMIKELADGNVNGTYWALGFAGLSELDPNGNPVRIGSVSRIEATAGSTTTLAGSAQIRVAERRATATIVVRSVPYGGFMSNGTLLRPRDWPEEGTATVTFVFQTFSARASIDYGNTTIAVSERDVKFSAEISGWPFAGEDNRLAAFLKVEVSDEQRGSSNSTAEAEVEDDGAAETDNSDSGSGGGFPIARALKRKFKLGKLRGRDGKERGAKMDFPEMALVDGVPSNITITARGPFVMVAFPAAAQSYYYDPTMAIEDPPSDGGLGSAAPASAFSSFCALLFALAVALLAHFM